MIEQKLMQINQYYPAHADGPLLEKRLLSPIYFSKNHPTNHHAPLPVRQAPHFIPSNNNHQDIRMDLCLESLNRALAIAIKINKYTMMSETQAICLYVLASQSSHDYTQDAYGQPRQSFTLNLGYQNSNQGPHSGEIQTAE